ncbi:MAG: flavodoxin-dependent (E)-4-hydroxy-3-methylbut-2-enyl-diphosphate synthase [Spirochaetes bacterium]|nr:flavodoxin-dependent (E)-4-hydroxy-3-methylbut-2-enyl-diphosphate synthase [Spirochaetota bacterium]
MTKAIHIGSVRIGGGAPVSVQSMTNTDTRDIPATVAQIRALTAAGCDIVRLAVIDEDAAKSIAAIRKETSIPLVADIHFDHKLALLAMEAGVHALRLNPGNIRRHEDVKTVVREAADRGIPIRVGVNAGSLDRARYREPTPENMVAAARDHITLMEDLGFTAIKVSLKTSSVTGTIAANRLFRTKYDYPLHLGVTEAGTLRSSLIKSSAALGAMLLEGIGDTIRISITGDPVEEVIAGRRLLQYLSLRDEPMVEIISCPTCGRTTAAIEDIASELERRTAGLRVRLTVAVMGCVVNGPGEARHADFGIAGTEDGSFLFFEKEQAPVKLARADTVDFLMNRINAAANR